MYLLYTVYMYIAQTLMAKWRPVVSVILWDFSMLEVGVVGCFVGIGWN